MACCDNAEQAKRMDALHTWLCSQDIPIAEWGPLFAFGCAVEIVSSGMAHNTASYLLKSIIDMYTRELAPHVKSL